MNPLLKLTAITAVTMALTNTVFAAGPAVVGLDTSRNHCQHVVDLLLRYGTSNLPHRLVVPVGNGLLLGDSIGDLELVSVALVDQGNAAAGPTIAVTVSNHGTRDVAGFSVSAVAILGRLHAWSPSITQHLPKVCAGETLEIQMQLPLESLAMGRAGTNLLAYQKLVVAIDCFDEWIETNETNNVLIVNRTAIPLAVPAVVQEPITPDSSPTTTPVLPRVSEKTPAIQPNDPTVRPSPTIDDIDFDSLEVIEE